ncbi:MAG: hypothetical protein KDD98_12305, partial [Sphingomonadaceae bacterium]|nr:hypothetical protein [Sphingomonadaceae bacterium]
MRFGYSVAAAVAAVSMVAIAPAPAIAKEKAKKVPPSEITIPAPQEGSGQVVFFRPGGMGGAVACSIHENGEKISSLGGGRYFILNTTPGRHEYSVKTEKTDTLALEVEDGDRKWVA